MSTWDCLNEDVFVTHIGWQRSTVEIWKLVSVTFLSSYWKNWSTKMHVSMVAIVSLWPTCCWRNGPSLLGSNKLVGKPCESKPKWHSAMISHHFKTTHSTLLSPTLINRFYHSHSLRIVYIKIRTVINEFIISYI